MKNLLSLPALLSAGLLPSMAPAGPASTNSAADQVLLNGALGQPVLVPTNAVPPSLLPPPHVGLQNQVPQPVRGMPVPEPVQERVRQTRQQQIGTELFPSALPGLMPYLGADHEYGNTAIRPDPLVPGLPWDDLMQGIKYDLSQYGLRYALEQTLTFVSMTDVKQGSNTLAFYTFDFPAKWAVYSTAGGESAGWISSQIEAKTGFNTQANSESAQKNVGTLTDPTSIWSKINGVRIPELAWQQSLLDGKLVAVAGMVNLVNYFDANAYADSGRGEYLNSALVNSMVLPLSAYNFGGVVAWQPVRDWYAIVGGSVGQASSGYVPWTDFTWNNWSLLGEVGYAPRDVLGLGPGVYRLQPFVAQAAGISQIAYTYTPPGSTSSTTYTFSSQTNTPIQAGLCFNLQQQLGREARFGWFGRFGFGQSLVSGGASAQVATGLDMRNPLEYLGLFPSRKNDFAGLGFVWSQPSWTPSTPAHENEYVLEAGYVIQLTAFARIQPDLQAVWNPASNPAASHALVFQFQLDVNW